MDIKDCKAIEGFFTPNIPEPLSGMWYHINPNGIECNKYCICPKVEYGKTVWTPVCRYYTIEDILPLLKIARGDK